MFENVNEVNKATLNNENNISLTREPTSSLLKVNVEYLDEIYTLLIIGAYVTKKSNHHKIERWFRVSIEWCGNHFVW